MEKKLLGIIPSAIVLEGVITYINTFFVEGVIHWQMVVSLVLGVVVAIAYKIDIPAVFEMKSHIPYFANVLSGILISRGSNYAFDLISKLQN